MVFDFFSDATPSGDQGIRYKGVLTVPFPASISTPDDALKLVAEVITVVPPDEDTKKDADMAKQPAPQEPAAPSQPAPAVAPALAEPTPTPIEPPPPLPTEVSDGQTIDRVVAALGQPVNIAKVGSKVIYNYMGLKVTFVNGKVKDVE